MQPAIAIDQPSSFSNKGGDTDEVSIEDQSIKSEHAVMFVNDNNSDEEGYYRLD